MNTKRFIIAAGCATLLVSALVAWLLFGFPDHFPGDPPATILEIAVRNLCIIAAWPFLVFSAWRDSDSSLVATLFLLIISGLF
jgi:hypothetical protein